MNLHDVIIYTSVAVETLWVVGISTTLLLSLLVIKELVWPQ